MSDLFGFADRVYGEGPPLQRLVDALTDGKARFEASSLPDLLGRVLAGRTHSLAAVKNGVTLDHFGLLLPQWGKALASSAASRAGFPLAHAAFPSMLFARDLGRLVGKRRLPTSIFKAYSVRTERGRLAVEIFFPNAPDAEVEAWTKQGIGRHLAIETADAQHFEGLLAAFSADGIPLASFMNGPVYIPSEDATMVYVELGDGPVPRLEARVKGDCTRSDDE